jgi:integrase
MKGSDLPSIVRDASSDACDSTLKEIVVGEGIPMRKTGERVHGPYQHHTRWRLVVDRNGEREKLSFASEAEAKKHKEKLVKEFAGRTVTDAVRAHIAHLRDRGLRDSTCERAESHLRRFFLLDGETRDGETLHFANTGGLVDELRPKLVEALYTALSKQVAVDTHRNALVAVKMFGAYCVKQGWLRSNPADDVVPVGQRNRGKKQLRIDEARKLVEVCFAHANAGNDAAVGVLTSLLMGMRASEVTDRVVRDLDDEGRLLWIGKTKRSRRTLEVPAVLRPYLLALAKDRGSDEQLITRKPTKRRNECGRQWLRYWLSLFCEEAKVPDVCVHSLRGLHATLATEAGLSSHVVANALGHSSFAVTQAHYLQDGTTHRMSTRRVVETLGNPHPVRSVPGTNRARSVPQRRKAF